jgi:pilus assembly protein CpaF
VSDLITRVRHRLATHSGPGAIDEAVHTEADGISDDVVIARLRRDVQAELVGAGPLEPLLGVPGVTDVLVNAPDQVWVDRGLGLERVPISFRDDAEVRALAQRLATAAGRRLDDALPFVDAALPDGTRLHAVLPPITETAVLSLRVLARRRYDLADLVARGGMTAPVADLLRAVVAARLAVVVTGGTGTGKTTVLGAMLGTMDPADRLVVIEDAAELVVTHAHVVRLVTRVANIEGAGGVGLRDLVRQALRMRPDRLVVGEFRGAEMIELLVAMNTGHEGAAATLHANSAGDVPSRFVALGALAGLDAAAVASIAGSAVDVVVALRRCREARHVDEIAVLARRGTDLAVDTAWSRRGGPGPAARRLADLLADRGAVVPSVLR